LIYTQREKKPKKEPNKERIIKDERKTTEDFWKYVCTVFEGQCDSAFWEAQPCAPHTPQIKKPLQQ
jgi:hypothetical protein